MRKHYAGLIGDHLRYAPPAHLEEIENEYARWQAMLTDLTGQQSAREQQLAAMRKARAESDAEIARTLEQLRIFVADMASRMEKVQSPAEQEALIITKRALEWEHNLQLLRAAAMVSSRTLLELQQEQDAERIAALSEYVQVLGNYRGRLEKARSQSLVDYAGEQLKREDLPEWRRTYWQMVMTATQGGSYFQELDGPTRNRFSSSAHDRLEARITRARAYWEDFMESLDRRPGAAILSAYKRVGDRLKHERDLLKQLRRQLDETIDEQRLATDKQSQLLDQWESMRARFDAQIRELEGENLTEARKSQAQLTSEVRAELEEKIQTVTAEQQAVRERLKNAVVTVDEQVSRLSRYRSRMYWSHLLVPGNSLSRQGWAAARDELESVRLGQGTQAEAWRGHWRKVREELASVSLLPWATGLILLLGSVLSGYQGRRWLPADGPVSGEQLDPLTFPARLELEARQAAAGLGPWGLPLAVLVVGLGFVLGWGSTAFITLRVPLLAVLAGLFAWGVIQANFNAQRPYSRLVPCSDSVAAYHRRWLTAIVFLGLLSLPAAGFLSSAGLLANTRPVLKATFMALLLTLTFIYFLRPRMFFDVLSGTSAEHDRYSMVRRLYPLLPLGVAGLALLEFAGYDALTNYIAAGLFWSTVVVWTTVSLWIPLRACTREAEEKLDQALTASESVDIVLDPRTTHPLVLVGLQILKALIGLAATLAFLYGWGVSPAEIGRWLDAPLMTMGGKPVQVWRVLAAIFAAAGGFLLSRGIRAFLQTQVFPRSRISRSAQAASCTLLHYSMVGIGIYAALMLLHFQLGALAVLLGTLGLGLGLGLQPVFVNFISGLLILFERQIRVGDIVEVGDQLGEVTAVSMRSTKIRTFDNVALDIPNGEFVTSKVVNWTLPDSKIRGKVVVGVTYDADEQLVRKLLLEIAERHPLVLKDPEPAVWFHNFGESSLDFTLACWFATPAHRGEFLMQIRFEIRRVFREHNLEMPFPQRTISLLGDKPLPIELVVKDGLLPGVALRPQTPPKPDPSGPNVG